MIAGPQAPAFCWRPGPTIASTIRGRTTPTRAMHPNLYARSLREEPDYCVAALPASALAGCAARPNIIPVSTSTGRRSRK